MKSLELFKKQPLFNNEFQSFKTYRSKVTENDAESFVSALLYGPCMTTLPQAKRQEYMQEYKKKLLEKMTLPVFFELESGYIALQKIHEMLVMNHLSLKKLIRSPEFIGQHVLYEINLHYLESIIEIIKEDQIESILREKFLPYSISKLDGERIQHELSNCYVETILDVFHETISSLMESCQLPKVDQIKHETFLKKLAKTLYGFFNYVTQETLEDLKKIILQDEIIDMHEFFHLYSALSDYNIFIIDADTMALVGDIDFEQYFNPEKKTSIFLHVGEGIFQPIFAEYSLPSSIVDDYQLFGQETGASFETVKAIFDQKHDALLKAEQPIDDNSDSIEKYTRLKKAFDRIKDFNQAQELFSYQNGIDYEFLPEKKRMTQKLYFFAPSHPLVSFLQNK